jgi:hypothetical protein
MLLAVVIYLVGKGSPVIAAAAAIGGLWAMLYFLLILVKFLLGQQTPAL